MKRITSFFTALALVLSLGVFLPGGITAEAVKQTYLQEITATDGGLVSFSADEDFDTYNSWSCLYNTKVTIYAEANVGYDFKGWRKSTGNAIVSTEKSISYTAKGKNSYTAVFELKSGCLKQTILSDGNGKIGAYSPTPAVDKFRGNRLCVGVKKDGLLHLYFDANEGYHLDYWQFPETSKKDSWLDDQYRFYPPKDKIVSFTDNVQGQGTYTAHFAINEYTVTFHDEVPAENSNTGHSYDIKNYVTVKHGDTVEPYTATPGISETYKPYVGVGWSLSRYGGADKLFDFSTPITKNIDLYLQYKASGAKYQINVVASPAEGGIAMETNHYEDWYYKPGETAMLTADPNEGYEFVYWIEDTQLRRQYINQVNIRVSVNGNTTYTAVFRKIEANRLSYAIVVQGGAPYAATNGSQRKYEAAPGAKMQIKADPPPRAGLVFKKWTVVSDNVTLADPYAENTTFTMPAGDVKIKAEYKTVYTVFFDANGGLGYMDEEYIAQGDELTLPECNYTAPDGMEFDKWELGKPGEKVSITADTTVKAVWKEAHTIHTLTPTAAKEATCTKAGNSAYWTCSECGKYFSDAEGTKEIAKNSWVIKAKGHSLKRYPATAATTKAEGNIEYWQCTRCGKYFKESTAKTEITKAQTVIPKLAVKRTPGDANRDSTVDVSDVLLVQQYLASWDVDIDLDAADYDRSGKTTVADVLLIQQKIAGWEV